MFSGSLFGVTQTEFSKSNKPSLFRIKKNFICNHDKSCAFYLGENNNLICHKCIYKYDIYQGEYIPLDNDVDYYIKVYQDYVNKIKQKIKEKVNEILKEIDKLELEKINDINSLFAKINLKFKLPVEVSFEERLKIAVNRIFSKTINNFMNCKIFDNFLNIYNTEINKIKTNLSNSYEKEVITLTTEIPFTLKGLAIPKINENLQNSINFECTKKAIIKSNSLFGNKNTEEKKNEIENEKINVNFEESEYNNLTIVRFENPINLLKEKEYEITITGIKGAPAIDNSEEYNSHNNTSIQTGNTDSILAGIIIE